MAAKYHKEIAEVYENEAMDKAKALEHYERAAELYEGEPNSSSSVKPCLLKVAAFSAETGDYPRARELFERVASIALETKLGGYGAKEFFLKAGLCALADGDVIATKKALEKYRDMSPAFERDRECKFLDDVATAVENYDVGAFTDVVADYDALTRLDPFLTQLLLKVKKSISHDEVGQSSSAGTDGGEEEADEGDMLT